jgi:hypothetical protein
MTSKSAPGSMTSVDWAMRGSMARKVSGVICASLRMRL